KRYVSHASSSFCRDYFSFFFSCRRRHTRFSRDWSSDVCSSDLLTGILFSSLKLILKITCKNIKNKPQEKTCCIKTKCCLCNFDNSQRKIHRKLILFHREIGNTNLNRGSCFLLSTYFLSNKMAQKNRTQLKLNTIKTKMTSIPT